VWSFMSQRACSLLDSAKSKLGMRVRRQGLEVNRENSRERRANLRSLARQFQPSLGGREQCLRPCTLGFVSPIQYEQVRKACV